MKETRETIAWLEQKFKSPDVWNGEVGRKWREEGRGGKEFEPSEGFKAKWAEYLAKQRGQSLADIESELNARSLETPDDRMAQNDLIVASLYSLLYGKRLLESIYDETPIRVAVEDQLANIEGLVREWLTVTRVRGDNQDENPASIRMRMRRFWGEEGRA